MFAPWLVAAITGTANPPLQQAISRAAVRHVAVRHAITVRHCTNFEAGKRGPVVTRSPGGRGGSHRDWRPRLLAAGRGCIVAAPGQPKRVSAESMSPQRRGVRLRELTARVAGSPQRPARSAPKLRSSQANAELCVQRCAPHGRPSGRRPPRSAAARTSLSERS